MSYANVIGAENVSRAFERFEQILVLQSDEPAREIKRSYKSEVYERAFDTGRYALAVDFRELSATDTERVYSIDTASDPMVTYDAFTDQGTIHIAARHQGAHGIENANLERVFDEWADTSFR